MQLDIRIIDSTLKIAPLIFVAFIENAFKYFSRDLPVSELSIALVENENQIIFECSNSYIELHKDQKGIGLINVSRRLELIYKNSYQLEISDQNGIYAVKLIIDLYQTKNVILNSIDTFKV